MILTFRLRVKIFLMLVLLDSTFKLGSCVKVK